MFGLGKIRLPLKGERREWIDAGFVRLADLVGAKRLREAVVALPTPEHFPERYDEDERGLQNILRRVADGLGLDAGEIDVELFARGDKLAHSMVPFGWSSTSGAAGLYHHEPKKRQHIALDEALLKDPMALVAVLAHELGHMILLRPGLVKRDEADMEPLTDLLTVFLEFGIFTANSAFRFKQYTDYQRQGWVAGRIGYLSEEEFGYALARFAFERGEKKLEWRKHLSTNVAGYMKRSLAWLEKQGEGQLLGLG
jgi:hypothetical protein